MVGAGPHEKKSRETEVSEKDTMRLGHGRKERQLLLLLPSLSRFLPSVLLAEHTSERSKGREALRRKQVDRSGVE